MRLFNSYLPELDVTTIRGELEAADRAARRLSPADAHLGPTQIKCPLCGAKLRVPDGTAGRTGRCRACASLFRIPHAPISAMAI